MRRLLGHSVVVGCNSAMVQYVKSPQMCTCDNNSMCIAVHRSQSTNWGIQALCEFTLASIEPPHAQRGIQGAGHDAVVTGHGKRRDPARMPIIVLSSAPSGVAILTRSDCIHGQGVSDSI